MNSERQQRPPRWLPKRSCSTPTCSGIVDHGGKCADCWRALYQVREAHRTSSTSRGYDDVHRRLRLLAFERDGWTCVDCGWQPDCVRDALTYELDPPPNAVILDELRRRKLARRRHLHGDHEIPIEDRPDLRTDLDNYKTRCSACHSAKTIREYARRAKGAAVPLQHEGMAQG